MQGEAYLRATLEMILACESDVATALFARGRVRPVERRGTVARQGDPLGTMWLILDGSVKIESTSSGGRPSQLALYGPGEWVGQYARSAVYPADIVAVESATLLGFASGELPQLAASHPALGATLAGSFARQLEKLTARLDARSTLTAKGRIYSELLHRAGDALQIAPPPVIAELAHLAQTTRETASRAIAELERRGIVARDTEMLRIHSRRLLAELVV